MGWTGGGEEISDFHFPSYKDSNRSRARGKTGRTFVPDPFVIDDQMISDEQLIVSIIDQKSILNFGFIDVEFLSKEKEMTFF